MTCCHHNYIVKTSESDLELYKKDVVKHKQNRRRKATDIDQEEENMKYQRNKGVLEKHMKDNSFKMNQSTRYELTERIGQLAELLKQAQVLTLKVLNSSSNIPKGDCIRVTCQGIANPREGYRNNKDGYVYFGYNPDQLSDIDYSICLGKSSGDHNEQLANIGRHFSIEYKPEKMNYFIRDLGVGFGTFLRLDFHLILKDNHLINIGETFLVANITEKAEDSSHISQQGSSLLSAKNMQLKLKVFGMNNNGETFYFLPMNRNIILGRYSLADIQLNDKLLSKIHCIINFSEKEGWKLIDGQENKPSTNGTWLYLNEDFEVYDKMIFKSNQTIFQSFLTSSKEC